MSAASDYGVALVERRIIPALADLGVFESNDPATAAGDVIAYLLHWVEAQPLEADDDPMATSPTHALMAGENHWEAERLDGDDIAQGSADHYRQLTESVEPLRLDPRRYRRCETCDEVTPDEAADESYCAQCGEDR